MEVCVSEYSIHARALVYLVKTCIKKKKLLDITYAWELLVSQPLPPMDFTGICKNGSTSSNICITVDSGTVSTLPRGAEISLFLLSRRSAKLKPLRRLVKSVRFLCLSERVTSKDFSFRCVIYLQWNCLESVCPDSCYWNAKYSLPNGLIMPEFDPNLRTFFSNGIYNSAWNTVS